MNEVERWIEGGQPNGVGEIEPSDYREWFTLERETHHRTVTTVYGPWEEGPTEEGAAAQERARKSRERIRRSEAEREDEILRKAEAILAKRGESYQRPYTEEELHGRG